LDGALRLGPLRRQPARPRRPADPSRGRRRWAARDRAPHRLRPRDAARRPLPDDARGARGRTRGVRGQHRHAAGPRVSAVLLHLHTGSLTGWFAEALRHSARASGEAPPSDAAVRARVLAWREWIEDGLLRSGHLTERLEWPEEDARPPESVAVPHDALAALRLLLACRERPPAPAELPEHPAAHP